MDNTKLESFQLVSSDYKSMVPLGGNLGLDLENFD